jgi:hypothetical protein
MRKNYAFPIAVFLLATLPGCEVVGGIFKAGVWSGIIIVIAVIILIFYLVSRIKKRD